MLTKAADYLLADVGGVSITGDIIPALDVAEVSPLIVRGEDLCYILEMVGEELGVENFSFSAPVVANSRPTVLASGNLYNESLVENVVDCLAYGFPVFTPTSKVGTCDGTVASIESLFGVNHCDSSFVDTWRQSSPFPYPTADMIRKLFYALSLPKMFNVYSSMINTSYAEADGEIYSVDAGTKTSLATFSGNSSICYSLSYSRNRDRTYQWAGTYKKYTYSNSVSQDLKTIIEFSSWKIHLASCCTSAIALISFTAKVSTGSLSSDTTSVSYCKVVTMTSLGGGIFEFPFSLNEATYKSWITDAGLSITGATSYACNVSGLAILATPSLRSDFSALNWPWTP